MSIRLSSEGLGSITIFYFIHLSSGLSQRPENFSFLPSLCLSLCSCKMEICLLFTGMLY